MDDKKIFDVTPPKTPESIESAKNARKMMLGDPMIKQDTNATPEIDTAVTVTAPEVNHQAKTIEPVTEPAASAAGVEPKQNNDEPVATEVPATITAPEAAETAAEVVADEPKEDVTETTIPTPQEPETKETDESAEPKKAAERTESIAADAEKEEPIKEINTVDSILPDDSQRAAAANKDAMQSPTMFDTKAYYVPIGNSQHKHGHAVGMIVAGLATTVFVLGTIYLYITFL